MRIHLFISLISPWYLVYEHYHVTDTQRCGRVTGMYILRIRISIEQQALIAIQEYLSMYMNSPMDYRSAGEVFFNSVFQELNTDLYPFGVHLRADYAQIIMENFPFTWDKTKCKESNPAIAKTEIAKKYFDQVSVHGVGNRLMVFYCQNIVDEGMIMKGDMKYSFMDSVKYCGNVLGVIYHDPSLMKLLIKEEILKMISGGRNQDEELSTTEFNMKLCDYTHECVSEIGSMIGEYVNNMKNIKDVSGTNFYLPVDSQTRVHGVFDNINLRGSFEGGRRLYPLDDYMEGGQWICLPPN